MSAPICEFVHRYAAMRPVRLHMPGHKGVPLLGYEPLDITEIDGADELFAPNGIIAESEANAGKCFGAHTFYSAGGSTLCIQAMLHLLMLYARASGRAPCVLAGRNAHRAFLNASALLGTELQWLFPENDSSYHSCPITPEAVAAALNRCEAPPAAVYLTCPDYLGNLLDLKGIAAVCHQAGTLLAVDNAHGAYLKFLPESLHPIDLGADLCCDSAHKTLPVVTGGAYLHISPCAPALFSHKARSSLSLFGSSSPSYLILQSLDAVNDRIPAFRAALADFLPKVEQCKAQLSAHGYSLVGAEPLKITLRPKSFGYTGFDLAQQLERGGIYPEFHDPDFVVLMLSPWNTSAELSRLTKQLCALSRREAIRTRPPKAPHPVSCLSPREAIFAESELLPFSDCLGRVCAAAVIGCPPAIPLIVCGEQIDAQVLQCFHYYGIERCAVIKYR